jgi:hypothetical protein
VGDWWDSGDFSFGGDSGSAWGDSFDSAPSYNFGGGFSPKFDTSWAETPSWAFSQQPMGGGWGSLMSNPQNLLGFAGGIAGLAGALSGGGVQRTQTPQLDSRQKAQFGAAQQANQGLQPFAQGMTPLQKQQQQLLAAITSGKGLDQGYARAVEGAFEPQMGNLYEQATQAGRKRGFHDAPATSPAGGNVLGPGLADLQGQIAQAKINMMLGLPALFQNPINSQIGAAQGFANSQNNLFNAYPTGQQVSAPLGPQIGQSIGQGLIGVGSAFGQQQAQNQQQQFQNRLMEMMFPRQQQTQTPFDSSIPNFQLQTPYQFGGYSGT